MKKIFALPIIALNIILFSACGGQASKSDLSSITGPDYTGKKYYLGFNQEESNTFMANEIKYDVLHTHKIFTSNAGGDYIGKVLMHEEATGSSIKAAWKDIGQKMKTGDMYVQYSSGHGAPGELMVGVTHNEIRDNALSYPAKEIIIFTMACYSGTLIDSFNKKKSVWENWQKEGRTLMVMSSSTGSQTSSTGPGTDSDEPNGPDGSAGSAFGHALWKALIGYSDGFLDGVKDGFISLGEIIEYTKWKTEQVGGHNPVVTGAFNPNLIMNKVPSSEFLESLVGGTEGLTAAEVTTLISERDEELTDFVRSGK